MATKRELSERENEELLHRLKERFENNRSRHNGIEWQKIEDKLDKLPQKIWSLNEMEKTGGEPDLIRVKRSIFFAIVQQKVQKGEGVFVTIRLP